MVDGEKRRLLDGITRDVACPFRHNFIWGEASSALGGPSELNFFQLWACRNGWREEIVEIVRMLELTREIGSHSR